MKKSDRNKGCIGARDYTSTHFICQGNKQQKSVDTMCLSLRVLFVTSLLLNHQLDFLFHVT